MKEENKFKYKVSCPTFSKRMTTSLFVKESKKLT